MEPTQMDEKVTYQYNSQYESQPPPPKRFSFSQMELRQLGISMVVLTFAFTMALGDGLNTIYWEPVALAIMLGTSGLAVATAFLLHELGHKFMAQKYGCWAEFRYWEAGLLMALVFSAVGFLFAAPGAVMINGRMSKDQFGKIGAAGPIVNIILGSSFLGLWLLSRTTNGSTLEDLFYILAFINAFIGGFNMIPISPFDGQKILSWSVPVYMLMAGAAGLLIALLWGIIPI